MSARRRSTTLEGEATLPQFLAAAAVTFVAAEALRLVTERAVNAGLDAGAAVVRPVGRRIWSGVRRGGRAVRRGGARALLGLSRRLESEGEARLREKAAEAVEQARQIAEQARGQAPNPVTTQDASGYVQEEGA